MTRRVPPPCRYIYVIGPEIGLQKIGVATDPRSRLAALQTASPVRLILHASIAVPFGAAHRVEAAAQAALWRVRAAGEWFDVSPIEAVAAVLAAASVPAVADLQPALPLFASQNAAAAPASMQPSTTPARLGLSRFWHAAQRALSVKGERQHGT